MERCNRTVHARKECTTEFTETVSKCTAVKYECNSESNNCFTQQNIMPSSVTNVFNAHTHYKQYLAGNSVISAHILKNNNSHQQKIRLGFCWPLCAFTNYMYLIINDKLGSHNNIFTGLFGWTKETNCRKWYLLSRWLNYIPKKHTNFCQYCDLFILHTTTAYGTQHVPGIIFIKQWEWIFQGKMKTIHK